MSAPGSVAVIGLGLIGGSVARGLSALGLDVMGYDSNPAHLDAAVAEGIVTERLLAGLEGATEADTVLIAVYGDSAVDVLHLLAPNAGRIGLIMDVGSTKQTIVSTAESLKLASRFVGAHPFAGDHRSGWSASRFDLFESQTVFLCPASGTSRATLALAHAFWESLGAKPLEMDAAAHDELLALTSHLPHVVSTALALALADDGIVRCQLGRGGRDVTRLAGGSPDMWTAILLDNSTAIEQAVSGVERQLAQFRELLRTGDRPGLSARLETARDWIGPAER
ncbi:MAG: prephenate dehydrogenase/arogenate dehydrogenase family protein [Gemmatimonadaceae bacterium]